MTVKAPQPLNKSKTESAIGLFQQHVVLGNLTRQRLILIINFFLSKCHCLASVSSPSMCLQWTIFVDSCYWHWKSSNIYIIIRTMRKRRIRRKKLNDGTVLSEFQIRTPSWCIIYCKKFRFMMILLTSGSVQHIGRLWTSITIYRNSSARVWGPICAGWKGHLGRDLVYY